MPMCFICKLTFSLNSNLITHLNIFHDPKSLAEFKCLEPNCCRVLTTFHSYKNHLTQHTNLPDVSTFNEYLNVTREHKNSALHIVSCPILNDDIPSSHHCTEPITIKQFNNTLHYNSISLASKWYNNSVIPRKIIQVLFDDIQQFNHSFLSILKKKLLEIISLNNFEINLFDDMLLMFDSLENPFSNINSEHLRFKALDEMGVLVRPRMVDIGCGLTNRMMGGHVLFEPKPVQMSVIPLRSVLKIILQDCNLFEIVIKYMKQLECSSKKCISNFVQSQLWQSKLKDNSQKLILPLFIYFDDFEINNALGSHAGNNKLGAVYASLACLPPEYSSSLENIFLVSLFKSKDRQEYGNHAVFSELISELKFLETTGIDVLYNGKINKVFFSLGLILGDNLGLHSMLGFSESFIANYPCRFCKSLKTECQHQVEQIDNNLRNEDNYSDDVAVNDLTLTGIKQLCIFNEINSFHVTKNYAVDIMHDILEGVCKYDIGMMLKTMIYDLNYFTIDILNDRIESFNYGPINIRNRPPLLSNESLRRGIIKMSASEMLCFTKNLALIIGELVPLHSKYWCLYITLKQIIDILLGKCLKVEDIKLCKVLIKEHHELYIKLFNTHLKPKFHHMIHYPFIMEQCGPLSSLWSMRFESKHKQLKETAKSITSRKNSPYTLALKHQLSLAYRVLSSNNNIIDMQFGHQITLSETTRLEYSKIEFLCSPFEFLEDAIFVSWINFKGTTYNNNNMSVLIRFSDNPNILPIFGLILSIFIQTDNIPFIICKIYENNYFDEHFQAYNVQLTEKLLCCSIEQLNSVHPTVHCVLSNNLSYIPL